MILLGSTLIDDSHQQRVWNIASAGLSPPERLLLNHVVETAIDRETAARYSLSRTTVTEEDVEASLCQFNREYKRLA